MAKKVFAENLSLSCTTSYGFLAPCQNLENTMQFQENLRTDKWTEEWMEGQIYRDYFIGPFQLLAGVQ